MTYQCRMMDDGSVASKSKQSVAFVNEPAVVAWAQAKPGAPLRMRLRACWHVIRWLILEAP